MRIGNVLAMKEFNITGNCVPERHYMCDVSGKMDYISGLVKKGHYFAITRGRQYGKTTLINLISNYLDSDYLVVPLSFEEFGVESWSSVRTFIYAFTDTLNETLGFLGVDYQLNTEIDTFQQLAKEITDFTTKIAKKVVIIIDEVDQASNNQVFVDFLGLLRGRYLKRNNYGIHITFYSVVLVGLYDIKHLKSKIRPDEHHKNNSPWNIAVDFDLDLSYNPQEIAFMLKDYESDNQTGMDICQISELIYKYTSGYPVLISRICSLIDSKFNKVFNEDNIQMAIKCLENSDNNPLFESITKNIESNPELEKLLWGILFNGNKINVNPHDSVQKLAFMFSIVKRDDEGFLMIHNIIFAHVIYNYLMSKSEQFKLAETKSENIFVKNCHLDMALVIDRFSNFLFEEYRERDEKFLEEQGRLLFLSFLKPIINGTGFYYVEPETRENRRMDVIVNYKSEEFIIELKIWRGTQYEISGQEQLSEYLKIKNKDCGYLVIFDFSKKRSSTEYSAPQWIEVNGKKILEVRV